MGCQVVFECRVKPDCVEKFQQWLRANLPDTRAFPGFMTLVAAVNQDNPVNIIVLEQWDTRQHYEKYIEWRTARGDSEVFMPMMDGEPSIRYYDYFGV